ncbi:MAG: sulfite exporter TauE/SafE family protein, partial [Clostridia bacterium]|nr:sulfite exporter TauE/SafE family protein [Clostridia bacterium]
MKCCIRCKKGDIAAAVTGLAAGFVNGLLGAGGGMILVPMLHLWCGLDEKEACATSVAIVAPMCALSAILYFAGGSAWPPQTLWYCVGGLAGG